MPRYFREDRAELGSFAGVPTRDLTDEEYEALPEHLQRAVDESPLYQKSRPVVARRTAVRHEPTKEPEPEPAPEPAPEPEEQRDE
jgi:hypothetical protein